MTTEIKTVPSRHWLLCAGLLLLSPLGAAAEMLEAPAAFVPPALEPRAQSVPRLLFEATALEPAQRLPAARLVAAGEIEAIGRWNADGREPRKTGFVRPLTQPLAVDLGAGQARSYAGTAAQGFLQVSPEGGLSWVVRFEIDDAGSLRLRLKGLEAPAEATFLVYGETGEASSFGRELTGPEGELWTPSVAGPVLFLEVHSPRPSGPIRFTIDALSERFSLDSDGRPMLQPVSAGSKGREITSCIERSACVTSSTLSGIASYRAAVALLFFTKDGDEYICSGSLLNDLDESGFIPYLLTANHCFSTQSAASSLEAYWDYHASSCGGLEPGFGSLPRSNGGTLLASSSNSDFTFLRLNSAPTGSNGRTYLGWTATPPSEGSSVYGLHYPLGQEQSYTRSIVDLTPSSVCSGAPTSRYLYANPVDGATFGGSSGSPITDASLRVVGQLLGGCGPNADEPCLAGAGDYDVFGAFSTTKSSLSQWLDATGGGGGGGGTPSCVDSPTTLCLLSKRFQLEATYRTASGQTGQAKVVRLTEETGYFWFFNASNIEVVFKLLDACGSTLNNRFWVFAGGLTDVEVAVTVTDTAATGSGAVRTFFNPLGTAFQPIADTSAFATCP